MSFLVVCGVLLFVAGISAGIKLPLVAQALVVALGVAYLSSERVRRMEIGGLIPLWLCVCTAAGMVAGDVTFALVWADHSHGMTAVEVLAWLFHP